MDKELLDLYTDYLISSFGLATATGLSTLVGDTVSHDQISRFLGKADFASADLWRLVKPIARQIQRDDGVLIDDDSVEAKPYTDESELNCWHWDHTIGRSVKGFNILTCLYYSQEVALPVAFELIKKPDFVTDKKTGKPKRAARLTKNELYRQMLATCVANQLPFRYVLNDSWFASAENMVYIKETLHKEFDGSEGIVYLVAGDTTLTVDQILTRYQKRWKVEEYHKSLKSNLSFAKSPTKTVRTQSNHIFTCLVAFVKLECLRMRTGLNHFARKAQLYRAALASAFRELQILRAKCSSA
jgi:hypothetical protein